MKVTPITTLSLLLAGYSSAFVTPSLFKCSSKQKILHSTFVDPYQLRKSFRENELPELQGGASNHLVSPLGVSEDMSIAQLGEKNIIPDCVVGTDYTLALMFGGLGAFTIFAVQASVVGLITGGLTLLFASFLAVQTKNLRFVFDETAFELKYAVAHSRDKLIKMRENIVVGGANRWSYDKFVDWDFFPKQFPIFVYFKEKQTTEASRNKDPGQLDKNGGGGQIHFFPAICNTKELEEQFTIRGCAKLS